MSNSPLVQYTKISPNSNNPRSNTISKITIHHMAGVLSVETCGRIFNGSNRRASSNYAVGSDGRIAMYVEEKNRAWTSSSSWNDNQAVTIEVSNSSNGGNWPVSDNVLNRLIELCVDICKRNPGIKRKDGRSGLYYDGTKNGSLTRHNMYANTACPGPYLQSKFDYIVEQVNKKLDNEEAGVISTPSTSNTTNEVITRKFKVGDKVVFSGILYADSLGNGAGQSRSNLEAIITRVVDSNASKPYNINNGLGWVAESDLSVISTSNSTQNTIINIGDTVIVNGVGRSTAAGTGASTKNYSNKTAKVIYVKNGASNPYALNCNNNMNGVTGWFKASSVMKK